MPAPRLGADAPWNHSPAPGRLAAFEDADSISPFTIRHSFASSLLSAGGVSIAEMALLMGSTKEVALRRCVHATTVGTAAAVEQLATRMASLGLPVAPGSAAKTAPTLGRKKGWRPVRRLCPIR